MSNFKDYLRQSLNERSGGGGGIGGGGVKPPRTPELYYDPNDDGGGLVSNTHEWMASNGYLEVWNEANAAGGRFVWPWPPWSQCGSGCYEIWNGDEEYSPQVTWNGSSWVLA
tara:strand:- start:600 stop:935 length:336 start_codon:yes stop_codon:yes gene_type:complete